MEDKQKTLPALLGEALHILGAVPEQVEMELYAVLNNEAVVNGDVPAPTAVDVDVIAITTHLREETAKVKELLVGALNISEAKKPQ